MLMEVKTILTVGQLYAILNFKTMKKLVFIFLMLLCKTAFSQQPGAAGGWINPNPSSYGTILQRSLSWKFLGIPTSDTIPVNIPAYDLGYSGLQFCTADSTLYVYHPTLHQWLPYERGSGGAGVGTTCNSIDETAIGDGTTMDYIYPFPDEVFLYNDLPNLASVTWAADFATFHFALAPASGETIHFVASSINCVVSGGGGGGGVIEETDPLFDTKLATKTTDNLNEGSTNLYWHNALGDARYPQLSGAYTNPTWITSLSFSKLTLKPTTLGGYGITDGVTLTTSQTLTSKTLISPRMNTTSTIGYAWIATDVLGNGTWAPIPSGGGGGGSGDMLAANNLSDLTDASLALTNIGGTTIGKSMFTLANPSAITFPRFNADNTVSALSASAFRTAIGATTVGNNIFTATNPSAVRWIRINADNTITFRTAAETVSDLGVPTATDYSFKTILFASPSLNGTLGTNFEITLTGNLTMTFTSLTEGYWYYLDIIQGGSGGYSLTLPSGSIGAPATFSSGTTLRNTTTVGATDVIAIRKKGIKYQIMLNPDLQ